MCKSHHLTLIWECVVVSFFDIASAPQKHMQMLLEYFLHSTLQAVMIAALRVIKTPRMQSVYINKLRQSHFLLLSLLLLVSCRVSVDK